MELLESAVADISLLLATRRALRDKRGEHPGLRPEFKRAAVAYLGALARADANAHDAAVLVSCRVAAEREMPQALLAADHLRAMMEATPGVLIGFSAARHDLWRLAHIVVHLRRGAARLSDAQRALAEKAAKRLGKRLRKALVAYARVSMRDGGRPEQAVSEARRAAGTELQPTKSVADASALARFEVDHGVVPGLLERGVTRPLLDLLIDWELWGGPARETFPLDAPGPGRVGVR